MKWHLANAAAQVALGQRLGEVIDRKALIFLQGDLGAGKTTLARGLLRGRGYEGNVKSPTYTLIEPYLLPKGVCYHLDLYRLADAEELEYLGLREMLAESAILLIEWPQRAQGWLPEADLTIQIDHAESGRSVELRVGSPSGQHILNQLQSG